ncbi:hypothetical protein [Paenarthrobacter sp. NPDC058040]|uniref:hypothetical protein n=1 Tax=unclassified Paenarthrobacter TaxID=2634190 RepID=UPI0036DE6C80
MTLYGTKSIAECTFSRHLLLRRWQTTSYQQGWRFKSDWLLPEVRTVVTSLTTRSTVPAPTAKSLGAARARNGVGIGETMTDFRALFDAADQSLDVDALQSLAEGWAEGAEALPPISCTDVYTGLATQAHFQRHLVELDNAGPEYAQHHALAVIALPEPPDSRSHGWTLLVQLGALVQRQLSGTGALATYRSSAIHVAFQVCESNLERLAACKAAMEALGAGSLSPSRMSLYPLSQDAGTSERWPELL